MSGYTPQNEIPVKTEDDDSSFQISEKRAEIQDSGHFEHSKNDMGTSTQEYSTGDIQEHEKECNSNESMVGFLDKKTSEDLCMEDTSNLIQDESKIDYKIVDPEARIEHPDHLHRQESSDEETLGNQNFKEFVSPIIEYAKDAINTDNIDSFIRALDAMLIVRLE